MDEINERRAVRCSAPGCGPIRSVLRGHLRGGWHHARSHLSQPCKRHNRDGQLTDRTVCSRVVMIFGNVLGRELTWTTTGSVQISDCGAHSRWAASWLSADSFFRLVFVESVS